MPLKKWQDYEAETATSSQYRTTTSEDDEDARRLISTTETQYSRRGPANGSVYNEAVYGDPFGSPSAYVMPPGVARGSVMMGGMGPTEADLLGEIRVMIANGNLMTMTKKQIREALQARFGIDLGGKREVVNQLVDQVLKEMGATRL